MSTRSAIGIRLPNGSIKGVYCHWDGYLSYNGVILATEYQDKEKVLKLVNLGDLSSLGEKIEPNPNEPHTFEHTQKGVCCFYGRDRGEKGVEARTFANEEDFVKTYDWSEYFYLLEPEGWKVNELNGEGFVDLKGRLREEGLI